jgi:L-rhamnose mutarotase
VKTHIRRGKMFSIGLSMRLNPGGYPGYKKAHDELWPEIAKSMADNSVSMSIYRFGDRLFLHAVAPTEADWLKSREDPNLERWSEFMTNYLESDGAGNIVFDILEEAFAFGMFKSE